MAENKTNNNVPSNYYAMAGGDGPLSYTQNSSYQRRVADGAKLLIQEAVEKSLSVKDLYGDSFCIADLGCSTGPNTFIAVQNILDAVKHKYKSQESDKPIVPEFHVYFNDHVSNDFNTLFRSFPPNKQYYASGLPGSFYDRLLPASSLHFVHSSYSLHWLSQLPKEITDRNSPAWNKGRIHYGTAGKEVIEAYRNQHARDFDSFLNARAREVVPGGLMAISVAGRPDGDNTHSQVNLNLMFDALGSCLVDLASQGKIDEEEVNAVNVPIYLVSPQELEAIVAKNGYFTLDRVARLPSAAPPVEASAMIAEASRHMRAVNEALITENIGSHILDELFDLYKKKLLAGPGFPLAPEFNIFALLKRKI